MQYFFLFNWASVGCSWKNMLWKEGEGGGGVRGKIVNRKAVFTAFTVTKFIVIIMMNLFFYRKSIPNVRSKGSLFHYQTGPFAKTCTYVSLPRSFMWKPRFLYIKVFIEQENWVLTKLCFRLHKKEKENNRNQILLQCNSFTDIYAETRKRKAGSLSKESLYLEIGHRYSTRSLGQNTSTYSESELQDIQILYLKIVYLEGVNTSLMI